MNIAVIIGAGMMGSAMSIPLCDNNHEVRLIGTHLDREIITSVQQTGYHPTLKRKLPNGIRSFQIEKVGEAIIGAELIICGVSSFGIDWFAQNIIPYIPDDVPVLAVTKGLGELPDKSLIPFPYFLAEEALALNKKIPFTAIGGPCTSYELADRRHSAVVFCGNDPLVLNRLKNMLETSYYHVNTSCDVIGVESAVALKNAYALAVTLTIGMIEQEEGINCREAYNPQAAIFGQSIREISYLVKILGGTEESVITGIADLYVTIFGGRTRRLGILLGRGLSFDDAIKELEGVTLESVAITTRIATAIRQKSRSGSVDLKDFPLLIHIDNMINHGAKPQALWQWFTSGGHNWGSN